MYTKKKDFHFNSGSAVIVKSSNCNTLILVIFEKFEFKGNPMFLKIVFGTFYSTDSMIVVFQIETWKVGKLYMKLKASLYPVKQQVLQSHIDKKLLFLHPILNFSVSALIQSILFIVIEAIETLKVRKRILNQNGSLF